MRLCEGVPTDCKDATGTFSNGSYPMDVWLTGIRNMMVHWTLPLMHGPHLTTRLMCHLQSTLHMRESLSQCSWISLRSPSRTQGRTLLQHSLKCLKILVLVIRYNCHWSYKWKYIPWPVRYLVWPVIMHPTMKRWLSISPPLLVNSLVLPTRPDALPTSSTWLPRVSFTSLRPQKQRRVMLSMMLQNS